MQAAELARNRWPDLLAYFGIERGYLTGRHGPCPFCGGRDRFRFDNKKGAGTWYCANCGSGDGFALLSLVKGWSFPEAANEVERIAGSFKPGQPKQAQADDDKLATCRRIWGESQLVTPGDPVFQYLGRRTGIDRIPACVRYHPSLAYRHDDGTITKHPAMLFKVQDMGGHGCALHRTYLNNDGTKADVPAAKKVLGSLPPGAAVQLFPPGSTLCIAEGIETALCASVRFGLPVWSALSAVGLERWEPPPGTERVVVFADNDTSFTGQAAAFSLAKRLTIAGFEVAVEIPERTGTDWADK